MDAFETLRKARFFGRVHNQFIREIHHEPRSWRLFAQCREAYGAFARWCKFKRKL